jgi:hypothetical protein
MELQVDFSGLLCLERLLKMHGIHRNYVLDQSRNHRVAVLHLGFYNFKVDTRGNTVALTSHTVLVLYS